jgi:hypothetical protein
MLILAAKTTKDNFWLRKARHISLLPMVCTSKKAHQPHTCTRKRHFCIVTNKHQEAKDQVENRRETCICKPEHQTHLWNSLPAETTPWPFCEATSLNLRRHQTQKVMRIHGLAATNANWTVQENLAGSQTTLTFKPQEIATIENPRYGPHLAYL